MKRFWHIKNKFFSSNFLYQERAETCRLASWLHPGPCLLQELVFLFKLKPYLYSLQKSSSIYSKRKNAYVFFSFIYLFILFNSGNPIKCIIRVAYIVKSPSDAYRFSCINSTHGGSNASRGPNFINLCGSLYMKYSCNE